MASCEDLESGSDENTPILHPFESRERTRGIPERYKLAMYCFAGFFNAYAMRVNLSVTMVAMVIKNFSTHVDDESIVCRELMSPVHNSTIVSSKAAEFDWDPKTQSLILSSFFVGYVLTQIPGGILAEKYGAKWLFGIGMLITSIFTLLTPLAAEWSVPVLMIVRMLEGMGEGVTFPAMNSLIGRWVPKLERSRFATIIYSGCPFGTVISLILSGYISASDELGGWRTVYYFFGSLGCAWFILWALFVYNTPEEHPRISKEELRYIRAGTENVENRRTGDIPWRAILTSRPVWALVITHFGYNWGFYTLLTELPTYLSDILHFNLKHNGLLSATPYICQAFVAYLVSFIADRMRASGRYKITTIRKIMNSAAFFLPCLFVGIVAFVGCQYQLIIGLIVASVAFSGCMYSGFNITHVDMSPKYAGTLMGITNCIANLAGFMAPPFVGFIMNDGQSVEKWGIVFLTTSGIYFVTGMIYNFFGSAELQPWGRSDQSSLEAPEKTPSGDQQ